MSGERWLPAADPDLRLILAKAACLPRRGELSPRSQREGLQVSHTSTCAHREETPLQAATFRSASPHLPTYELRMKEFKPASRNQPSRTFGESLDAKSSSVAPAISVVTPALPPGDEESRQRRCSARSTPAGQARPALWKPHGSSALQLARPPGSRVRCGSVPRDAGAGGPPASLPPAAGLLVLTTRSQTPSQL